MDDLSLIVSSLEYKVKKLIDLQKKSKEKIKGLTEENKELLAITNQQKSAINNLDEKYKISRLANMVEKGNGTAEVKLKINEMVREIDKCIALLKR